MPGVFLIAPITGTVNLSEPITGTVGLSGPITGAVKITEVVQVTGGLGISGPITGNVGVTNFPAVQTVTGSVGLSGPITGTVAIANPLTGTFGLSGPVTGNVGITNFPAIQTITGSVGFTGPITGTVGLSGPVTGAFKLTEVAQITGTVGLSGPVTGAVKITESVQVVQASGTTPWSMTGSVGLTGPITGTVGLSGPVTGNVGVTNFPAVQAVTGTIGLSGPITGTVVLGAPITGTVGLSGPVTGAVKITEAVQVVQASGTVPWQMTGTVGLSGPITGTVGLSGPVTGAFKITEVAAVTGALKLSEPITGTVGLSGPVTGTVGLSGPITGTVVIGAAITGTVGLSGPVTGNVGLTGPVTGNFRLTEPVMGTSFRQVLLSASQLGPGTGFAVIPRMPFAEPYVVLNIKGPIGIGATASFYFDELDPLDQSTLLQTDDSGSFSDIKIVVLESKDTVSDTMRLYWQVTGSMSGVNATCIGRWSGNAVEGQAEDGKQYNGEGPVLIGGVDNSNLAQVAHVDSSGNLQVVVQTVAAGTTTGEAFGQANVGASANTLTVLRATTYTEQTGSAIRSLKSTSAADLSGSGTGAWQVKITYYDSSLNGPFSETVNMNGTGSVNTVNSMAYIEKMEVIIGGSAKSNQGTISIFQSTNGNGSAFGSIGVGNLVSAGTVGDNRTLWAHHYVAAGKTMTLGTVTFGTDSNQTAVGLIKSLNPLISNAVEQQIVGTVTFEAGGIPTIKTPYTPVKVSGPARVTGYAISNGSNNVVLGGFEWQDA